MTDDHRAPDHCAVSIADIVEQIGNAVVATGFDGRVLYWNPGAERLYAVPAEEMMGHLFSECCRHDYLKGEDEQSISETVDHTGKWSGTVLQTLTNGRQILVECERYLFRDGEGRPMGTMAMMRDVTDERQKDLEHFQSRQRARQTASREWEQLRGDGDVLECFLKNLPICAYVKDEQGCYLFNNKATTQFTPGINDWIGKDDEELFGAETGRPYRQSDLTALTSGQPIRTIESGPLRGQQSTFLTVKFPISAANGRRYLAGVSVDITDSIRDREQLRRQSALLDLSNSAIIMVDLEDRVSYWNHGAERLYGWTAAETVGKSLPEVLRAEFSNSYDEIWAQYLREGSWEGEFNARTKQGDPITVLSKWSLLRDASGNPVSGMVISTDVTAIKLAFEELRRAEAEAAARAEELAAILDAVPAAIFIAHDRECRRMTSSRAAFDLLHLPQGANPSKSAPPEERSGLFSITSDGAETHTDQSPVQRAALTGFEVRNSEFSIALADGTVRDVFGHAVPLLGADGQVRGAVGAFIDVTERNRAEQAAHQNQAILKAVLDATSDIVFLKDLSGRYMTVNPAAARRLGMTPEEVIGKDDYALFPAAIAGRWIAEDREVLATGQSLTYEDELPGKDGTTHLLSVKSVCMDADGRILGVMGVSRDITQRKALELELRQRERDLSEAHRIAGLGTWRWSRETGETIWSDEVFRIFARDPKMGAMSFAEICERHSPESRVRLQSAIAKVLSTGEPYELDFELHLTDGTVRWILDRCEVEAWHDGQVAWLRGTLQEITERKKIEQQIAFGASRYRSLVRATTEIVWTARADGLQASATQEWVAFTGQPEDSVAGFGWADPIHPEDRERTIAAWMQAAISGESFEVEHRLRRRDGVYRNMLARAVPVRDESGQILEWVGTHTDVTELKRAEAERQGANQQLVEAHRKLESVLNSITDGLAVLDHEWRYTYINERGASMFGLRPEQFLGQCAWELFPRAEDTAIFKNFHQSVATRSPVHFEEYYPEPENKWLECHCYPSAEGLSVYFRDITERKLTERALHESESRFRRLFESDLMGIGIPDRFGAFTEANDELLRIVGYSREDLNAGLVRWDTMTPPEYRELDVAHIAEAAQRGSCTPYEKEYFRKDGSRVPIMCGYALLEGSQDRYIGFVQDLTAQKRAEEALRKAEKLTTAGRFAASMAHEINNPLAAVTNTVYLALQDPNLHGSLRELLNMADRELARISQVVTQNLRFHRQLTAPQSANLCDVMDSVLTLLASRISAGSISVEREYLLQEKLWCFSNDLRHAFASIVSNALDAAVEGMRLRIRIKTGHAWRGDQERGVRVIVADSGHGIPPHMIKRVFDAFITTKEHTGTGLGLWVTEEIVAKHKGRIALRSATGTTGHGTVVSLFFPFDGVRET